MSSQVFAIESSRPSAPSAQPAAPASRASPLTLLALFLLAASVLFLGQPLVPNVYDEGMVLTGAMRVLHGQLPHRDFYTNYGPAQYYVLAALFRLFGQSVLTARVYDIALKSALLAGFYALLIPLVRRPVAVFATALALCWLFALNVNSGTAVVPVSLLALLVTSLLLPAFRQAPSHPHLFALGAVAAVATLFRYDTGLALLAIELCALATATCLRIPGTRARAFLSLLWPTLAAFAVVLLPPAIYYLRRAPFSDLYNDVIFYPHLYYYRYRNLPFPHVGRENLDELVDYLPIPILAASIYAIFRARSCTSGQSSRERSSWLGPPIVFSLMTLVFFCKGFVRLAPVQLYLCIVPSILLLAVLYELRDRLGGPVRAFVVLLVAAYTLAAGIAVRQECRAIHNHHAAVFGHLLRSFRHTETPFESTWCGQRNPFTEGLCFQPDKDRIQAIEYLGAHTRPTDALYVGLPHHDRILANDNSFYFGANRLPATRWSVIDPGLQNSAPIQQQMILDLQRTAPPYIALDSKFLGANEPNDSSKSTGVTLLDTYIQNAYQPVQTFGAIAIYRKR